MSKGLHNRVKKRLQEEGKYKSCFYEEYYASLKTMMGYLLECSYIPLSFEKEHELDYEFREFRKIWKKHFKIPYLKIKGLNNDKCPEAYKKVYREWIEYLKSRLAHIRSLYLIETIAECIHDNEPVDRGYLFSYIRDINNYVDKKVWPLYWLQEYNKKFFVEEGPENNNEKSSQEEDEDGPIGIFYMKDVRENI